MSDAISLGALADILGTTEPISSWDTGVDDGNIQFILPEGWNVSLKEASGTHVTQAQVTVPGTDTPYNLTKDAILLATSAIGITKEYVCKTPGHLIEAELNYWYSKIPASDISLTKFGQVLALLPTALAPISNLGLLSAVEAGLRESFGAEVVLEAHPKYTHDLRVSQFRVHVVADLHAVATTRQGQPEKDTWSVGIDVQNSLVTNGPLQIKGYFVGMPGLTAATHRTTARFSRKGDTSPDAVHTWALKAVETALADVEHELEALDGLVSTGVEGALNDTTQDVFERYRVPPAVRKPIMDVLVEDEDLTMYGVLHAFASVANHPDTSPQATRKLMEVGGELIACASNRCGKCFRLPLV